MASSRKSTAKKGKQIQGNTSRDHIHRLFLIFSEVQNKRYPSLSKLSKICEVDTRTIQHDIAQLNALLGNIEGEKQTNEIVHDKARRGYALRGNLRHLPIVQIGDRDLLCPRPMDQRKLPISLSFSPPYPIPNPLSPIPP